MRERIESALTWLEDHGLLEYLYSLFVHQDLRVSVSLRDIWVAEGYSKPADRQQIEAIAIGLDGMVAEKINNKRCREYRLKVSDTFQVVWSVYFKLDEGPLAQRPEETPIFPEMQL